MDRVSNSQIRELCSDERGRQKIDEGVLQGFGHVERVENMIAKRVSVEEWAGSHSVVTLCKRWIDIVKDCLRKRGFDVKQARRMVQDRSKWW